MEFVNEVDTIHTFRELMDEIAYSWEQQFKPPILKHDDGTYSINKLYIGPDFVQYKESNYRLAPGVFTQFEAFYRMCVPETV